MQDRLTWRTGPACQLVAAETSPVCHWARCRSWHPRAAAPASLTSARPTPSGASVVASGTLPQAVVDAASMGDASSISSWLADDRCVIDACSSLDGCTALHAAARAGHVHLVRLLLEAGADALAVDSEMRTPLHHVAAAGHGICVKALLDAGSDPEGEFSLPHFIVVQEGERSRSLRLRTGRGELPTRPRLSMYKPGVYTFGCAVDVLYTHAYAPAHPAELWMCSRQSNITPPLPSPPPKTASTALLLRDGQQRTHPLRRGFSDIPPALAVNQVVNQPVTGVARRAHPHSRPSHPALCRWK